MSPSSLLVPVNTEAVFECIAYCVTVCDVYWHIGDYSTLNNHQKAIFIERGFVFFSNSSSDTYRARLSLNASISVNNTRFQCNVLLGANIIRSDTATLLVISGELINSTCHTQNAYMLVENLYPVS